MKQKISRALKSKNIILFGVTEQTKKFYGKYSKILNIRFCVTNYSENVILQPMQEYGLETKLYDDVNVTEEDYFVLCDYEFYQPVERRLQTEGFVEYENYISSELAVGILEEKQIAVFMGSYILGQTVMGLELQPEIKEKYFCVFYPEYELLKPYRNRIAEYKHIARVSDVYVTSICDKIMYDAKVLAEETLLDGCRRIKVSDVNFGGYYPQMAGGEEDYSWFLYRERKRFDISYRTLALSREDMNLKRCIDNNMPVEEIIEYVSDPEFYTEEQVKLHFSKSLEKIKKIDKGADVQLADFIERESVNKVVCRNLDEWNVDMVQYVVKQVATKMGVSCKNADKSKLTEQIEVASGSELPIYPSVLKYLNIQDYKDKKYKVVSYYKTQYLDFEEYMRYSVECMYQIKELNDFLGIEGD